MTNIKELRQAIGLTQDQLAKIVGRSRINICRYETGEHNPPLAVAAKLAAALGCTVDDLLDKHDAN